MENYNLIYTFLKDLPIYIPNIHYLIFSILPESEAEFTVNMSIEGRAWLVMFHYRARNVSQFLSLPRGQSWKDSQFCQQLPKVQDLLGLV